MTTPVVLRSEPDITDSFEPFQERLAETISWCLRAVKLGPLATALRTMAFVPPPALPWPETVRAVAEARLKTLGRSWRRTLDPLGGGELLIHLPRHVGSSGGAGEASGGYFDAHDLPPWDTWVSWLEEPQRAYLVCWVPPEAMEVVAAGMAVAGESLAWLASTANPVQGRLKRASGESHPLREAR
ncbi:MAG: hypothetical protein OEW17_00065 [Gemmatimonadota bacterium]|nr:hypothetical protein [Gemmatimonadota bacterium]MDH4347173.1 hypothetical protein [Gemmatimonadota bacterium]MDH5283083.1 hypothetical protein [Gemmatimonadota bacterium]